MSFEDVMKSDFANTILNTDEIAEEITYVTKAGVSKTISAIIDREGLQAESIGGADTLGRSAVLTIANDATIGVDAVDPTGDTGLFPDHVGKTPSTYRITKIHPESSSVNWILLCEK